MDEDLLRHNSYNTLIELITEEGINASGKDEVFGCIFGRDSAITVLKILNALSRQSSGKHLDKDFLFSACKRSLLTLVGLQGTEINIESGEEPGKFIHEYRTERFDHLVKLEWYLYPDGKLRNYDSIDSTPLALIAIHRYYQLTRDGNFLLRVLPAVENGLKWMIEYGDKDKDFLLEYEFHKERKSGGLMVQSWTDSIASLTQKDGKMPVYPIAPVEVQGYAWLCFKLWSDFYFNLKDKSGKNKNFAEKLLLQSKKLKSAFNNTFLFEDQGHLFPAQALDGRKDRVETVTGNPLLLLWSAYVKDGKKESILDDRHIGDLVKRSFKEDLFDETAGIRTMSSKASIFNPNQDSYHNGSFWPKLNGMAYEGLLRWEFKDEAKKLRTASLLPIYHFKMPIELYIKKEKGYMEYKNSFGQVSCKKQAWSAASLLDFLT